MRKAQVFHNKELAGVLEELDSGQYRFTYNEGYTAAPVSLTMPVAQRVYDFDKFPAVFEGLLPEGTQLEALLRLSKIDRHDLFGQLLAIGQDVVGALRIEEVK